MHIVGEFWRRWEVREGRHLLAGVDDGRFHDGCGSILVQLGLIAPQSAGVVCSFEHDNIEALLETGLSGSHAGSTGAQYGDSFGHLCGK